MIRSLLVIAMLISGVASSPALGHEPWIWQPEPGTLELVAGNIDMGKSHAARVRCQNVRRFIAWDPQCDEAELGHGRVTVNQLEALVPRLQRAGVIRLAVRSNAWSREELIEDFDRTCRAVYRIGAAHFKVEECGAVVVNGQVPGAFDKLLREGRHRRLSYMLVAQRMTMFPVVARVNARRIIAFRQAGPDDVRDTVDRVGELGEQVRDLAPRHYLEWTPAEGARIRPPLGTC